MLFWIDKFINSEQYKEYVICQGKRYWPDGQVFIGGLPVRWIRDISWKSSLPPEMIRVKLPEWADDIGIDHTLLIPQFCMAERSVPSSWIEVDWFLAAFWYLSGISEWQAEQDLSPIHSYSFRLKGWDERIWQHAWVNRIFLFLRRWAARNQGSSEEQLFGKLPEFKIHLTHDVDAVSKTVAIRVKQAGFHFFNGAKALINRNYALCFKYLEMGSRFLFLPGNYWCFEQIQRIEEQYNQKSCFNFFAGKKRVTLKDWLFNPGYNVGSHALAAKIRELQHKGWQIGLHQGFENWSDPVRMVDDKKRLEKAAGKKLSQCRQHWLRFSWKTTWKAQQKAGFKVDTTLAFNDRPGLRTGAALCYHPWDFHHARQMELKTLPTIFMDSHFYDYNPMDDSLRQRSIRYWIDEVRAVRGEASIIWHQRVFAPDYGWRRGYENALQEIIR